MLDSFRIWDRTWKATTCFFAATTCPIHIRKELVETSRTVCRLGRYRNIFWGPVNYKFILRFSVIPVTFLDIFVAKVGTCR
jgi:hypothetical protein